jgi:hypothetical protein
MTKFPTRGSFGWHDGVDCVLVASTRADRAATLLKFAMSDSPHDLYYQAGVAFLL